VFRALDELQAWPLVLSLLATLGAFVAVFVVARGYRTRGTQAGSMVTADEALRGELSEISTRLAALERGMAQIVEALPRSIQGVGVVRYNPFPEMGSNMSFSLALLDGRENGVVVSVLTNRDGSRVYGKSVQGGTSSYPLSDEERKALALARGDRG
jgi:hypothetical protein